MTAQLDLFADPVSEPVIVETPQPVGPFDHQAWSLAQNPTTTRCDRCANWTRTGGNYWGECSARKSYEHEYGGAGCESFSPSIQPIEELSPFMQFMVIEHPDSEHGRAWRAGKRRVGGTWVTA